MAQPRPLRYGIIGAGMMGLEHLRNLLAIDHVEVVAAADPHPASLEAAQLTVGPDHELALYGSHRRLLAESDCDVVVVATPNMTHAEVLVDLFEARPDLHVLVEKPLCTTVGDCKDVVARAKDHRGVIWVGLEYRYMPPVARLIEEVRDGTAGRVHMVAIREHRYPFLPKVENWNRFNRNTGGTLVEKCCHFFDLMNLLSASPPTRVLASGAQDVNHLDETVDGERPDILDNAFVIVDYADGIRASLDLCMFAEGSRDMEAVSVVGDRAKLEALLPSGVLRIGQRRLGPWGVEEVEVSDPRVHHEGFHHGASYLEHLGLLEAIRQGRAPEVGLEEGLLSVAMGVAAHRSIDEGRAVAMHEVLAG